MTTTTGHTSTIRATKVIGTSVYNPSGDRIGKVEDVILDKTSNNIMFAVVGFGGFLGKNETFHPLPWSTLDYQKGRDGYVVNMTKEQLEAAPSDGIDELTRGEGNTALRDGVYDDDKAPRDWQQASSSSVFRTVMSGSNLITDRRTGQTCSPPGPSREKPREASLPGAFPAPRRRGKARDDQPAVGAAGARVASSFHL